MNSTESGTWDGCRNLLCIRADNMGDLIMSSPALRALKKQFGCRITVLTSSMGQLAVPFIPEIDDCIVMNLPWVRHSESNGNCDLCTLATELRKRNFDGLVIFTVYSQSAFPAAMLGYMAGIPKRLAYSRENPYDLLTHWIPDKEPYTVIKHQVERDLQLVEQIGAKPDNGNLSVYITAAEQKTMLEKLKLAGVDLLRPFLIFHPGVSEEKRRYPSAFWIAAGASLPARTQILVTGTDNEQSLTRVISQGIGQNAFDIAGLLTVGEFIAAIDMAAIVVSVNTSAVHLAAARQTPVVVLYAGTNPQHTPWKVPSRVLPFTVPEHLTSKNEIICWVNKELYRDFVPFPEPAAVVSAILELCELPLLTGTNIVNSV